MTDDGVTILDDFIDGERLAAAYPRLRQWGRIPHGLFHCSLARLERRAQGVEAASAAFMPYFGELTSLVLDHLQQLVNVLPTPVQGPSAGIELWFGCNHGHDDHVYVHMDTHSGPHGPGPEPRPAYGSILHIGPSRVEGGSTYLCPVKPIPPGLMAANRVRLPLSEVLSLSPRWIEAKPKPGRVVIFDGSLPHFRAPVRGDPTANEPRIVLLANVWDHLPKLATPLDPIAELTPRELEYFTRMRPDDAVLLRDLVQRYGPEHFDALVRVSRRLYARPH